MMKKPKGADVYGNPKGKRPMGKKPMQGKGDKSPSHRVSNRKKAKKAASVIFA